MFANLSQGNVLYGLETKGDFKVFAAPITKVSTPYPGYINNNGVQTPTMVVDIVATINGENQEFKQVPSNISIADFGLNSYVLADNKDSLNVHINTMLNNSRKVLDNIEFHKELLTKYTRAYKELNPGNPTSSGDSAVQELRKEMNDIKGQFGELITLLKSGLNTKTE